MIRYYCVRCGQAYDAAQLHAPCPICVPIPAVEKPTFALEDRTHRDFRVFHRDNPHVYDELRRMALDLRARGRRQYGIAGLWEVLRWRWSMQTDTQEEYKLRNAFRAYYARLLMHEEPQLEGFFDTARSAADGFDFDRMEVDDE
jgi:hypothetical protein